MKTPVGLRPAAWEPRTRLVVVGVLLLLVAAAIVLRVTGAEGRRVAAACDSFTQQRSDLERVVTEVQAASQDASAAGSKTVLGYFDDVFRELNTVRRWQSTYPRLVKDLDQSGGDGAATTAALGSLTDDVAEMQRLIEEGTPAEAEDYTSELESGISSTADFCADV